MKKLTVNLGERSYDIIIKKNLRFEIGKHIKTIYKNKKIFVITDDNLNNIYGKDLNAILEKNGFDVKLFSIKPGETSKSFEKLQQLYSKFTEFEMTRSDLIIAFGGGVVGDLAGFAAATFLRGIDFIQIPTSLLAQVDSSVGGKVAVNIKEGKNLVGNFYQPKLVLIDTEILKSLPEKNFNDGLGEVIKYGCIKDKKLFEKLETFKNKQQLKSNIGDIIYNCCDIKRIVVENDEKDLGERMLLNFGHTIGHSIEKHFGYGHYAHGEAVGIGMNMITQISEEKGLTQKGTKKRIDNLLRKYNLKTEIFIKDKNALKKMIKVDKKNINGQLNIILLKSIGQSYIYKTTIDFFDFK